jgi:6-phosphogluconolactonase
MPKLHIYKNEKETCHAFAGWLAELVKETLATQNRFTIAVSAGDTPKLLFKILATDYRDNIDWSKIYVFWGEERFVSSIDEKEYSGEALKACMDSVPIPKDQIHTINKDIAPQQAAEEYQAVLKSFFKDKETTFDLIILGIGQQGNILSLLPNNERNNFTESLVIPVYDKQEDLYRITLTISAINGAITKAFIVVGKKKEDLVQQVLKGKYEPEKYPAQLVVSANKAVNWFLDEGAAGKLIRPAS